METVHLGLAGFGTVGSGLAKILAKNSDLIEKRLGKSLAIKTVLVRDTTKARAAEPGPGATFTTDPETLVNDPDIAIVVELMGGLDAAGSLIRKALNAGKHVVTANKHLLAEQGLELYALAAQKGVGLFYEASVAGGIPVVQALKESLAGDRITEILGILNGTANYILSEMSDLDKKLDFDQALSQAKDLGYAEADPTLDIEGHDTAHKLTVLIRLAFGVDYPLAVLPVEGITKVTPTDIEFAREFGYRVKLIAEARLVDSPQGPQVEAGVFPAFVKYTYLLARVGGNYNAVRITGDAVGPVMLHGQGAGDTPTGSAVLADIMALVRHMRCTNSGPDNTGFGNADLQRADILPPAETMSMHYLRFTVQDRPGVMAAIAGCLAEKGISISQVVQKGEEGASEVPVVFLTHQARAQDVNEAVAAMDKADFTLKPTVRFRIL